MSLEAPTRSAISCCVIFSGICCFPVLLHRHVEEAGARRVRKRRGSARMLHAVRGEARRGRLPWRILSRAKSGFSRMASRMGSRATTENVVDSRGHDGSRSRVCRSIAISPRRTRRARACRGSSRAPRVGHEDLDLALSTTIRASSARVAFGDMNTLFLGYEAHASSERRRARARTSPRCPGAERRSAIACHPSPRSPV
jgi:hypothetical protein